jgi:hypothetical protein
MKLEEPTTTEQLEQFLNGTQAALFEISSVKKERYDWIRHELIRFKVPDRGSVNPTPSGGQGLEVCSGCAEL